MKALSAIFQSVGRDAGVLEDTLSYPRWQGLVQLPRRAERVAAIDAIGRAPADRRMRPEPVVPDGEVFAEPFEMVESPDEGDTPEPFVLQGLDGPLGDGDGAVLADGAEALLYAFAFNKLFKRTAFELDPLVRDDVLRRAIGGECLLHSVNHPPRVGAFQGPRGDDLSGEMVDSDHYINRPDAPPEDSGKVHAPDMVGVPGRDAGEALGFSRLGAMGRRGGFRLGLPGLGPQVVDLCTRRGGFRAGAQIAGTVWCDMPIGRVVETLGVRHVVQWEGGHLIGFPAKRLGFGVRGKKNLVAVGDQVSFRDNGDGTALTEEVLPRRNKLSRRMSFMGTEHVVAANVDMVAAVLAPTPTYNPFLIDRYLAAAACAGIDPLILCNKSDLAHGGAGPTMHLYESLGYRVLVMSALKGDGLERFREAISGKWVVLLGHSGVGKTTLVGHLSPGLDLRVAEVYEETGKGRHTTAKAAGYPLGGGTVVVDTAGIREFALYGVEPKDLAQAFPEVWSASSGCRFPDCLHDREPGCAVRDAAEGEEIGPSRYESYLKLLEEVTQTEKADGPG